MIRRSRTSIAKVLHMSVPEIVRRRVGIVEIAVAGEDVRAAAAVVVVVGAVVAVEVEEVVMAVGMAVTAAAEAEGIKPRIIYEGQNPHPVAQNATRVGHPDVGSCEFGRGSLFLGRICLGEQEMLGAFL